MIHQLRITRTVTAGLSLLLAVAGLGLGAVPAGAVPDHFCQDVTQAVALGPGLPADQTIKGTLCTPARPADTIDILVHGASYNRGYWDFPVNQPLYSYVGRTLVAGRATFAYDRLGAGQSSRPLSAAVTVDADAYVLHQVVGWARTTQHFSKVDIVAHSLGSSVSLAETATYNDANRLVLTGLLHTQAPGSQAALADLYPAVLDPQFASQAPDSGYLTTVPGTRGALFYSVIADPSIIAYDEAHKDIASATQFGDAITQLLTPAPVNISQNIHVPVLTVVGAQDFLFCVNGSVDCGNEAAILANEQPYFGGAPSLSVASITNTGHDLTLHPTAGISFVRINSWINSH